MWRITFYLFLMAITGNEISATFWSKYTFSYPRESPIDISSNLAKQVNLPPLRLNHPENDKLFVNNTGSKLLLTLDQPKSSSIITGGPLFDEKYTFNQIQFIFTGSYDGSCSHIIDGRGTAVEMELIYTNIKYKTFEDSLNHLDGLVILSVPIIVEGHIDNPHFEPFQKVLEHLVIPNHKPIRTTIGGELLKPFFILSDISFYYTYPGTYIELATNKFSYCATVIVVPDYIRPIISIDQFTNSFLLLKTANKSPLTRPLALFSSGIRPVVQANGTWTSFVKKY